MLFGQTFDPSDLATIALLIFLEGLLSIDNALVLGLLARRVPIERQNKALTYGLIGALVFRLLAVLMATYLLRWQILKLLGGLYLIYLSLRHLLFVRKTPKSTGPPTAAAPIVPAVESSAPLSAAGRWRFWKSVIGIELTDLAFGVDNVLAAVALVGPPPPGTPRGAVHPKLWVIVTGGMIGLVLMRFAAAACIQLLRCFPRFNSTAYLIVVLVALKMVAEWAVHQPGIDIHLNFQNPRGVAFWTFWIALAACFAIGFLPLSKRKKIRLQPLVNADERK